MTGYTPDEKLRLQQLRELRRRWLKDQELSPREPVLPPQRMWPMERFWNNFLQDPAPWRRLVSDRPSAQPSSAPRLSAGMPAPWGQTKDTDVALRPQKSGSSSREETEVLPRLRLRQNAALSQESWPARQGLCSGFTARFGFLLIVQIFPQTDSQGFTG